MAYHDSTTASGANQTPSVAVPNGGGASPLQADDIVILVAATDDVNAVFDAGDWPTGFTELGEVNLTGDGHSVAVGWKRLTAADTGNYTFGNLGGGATPDWVCQAYAFRGRHTTDPPVISAIATNNNANTTPVSVTANEVTAVAGDDLLMISAPDVRSSGVANGHTQPTNYTEKEDAENAWSNLAGFTRENVSVGATGNITATLALTSSSAGWAAILVRIPAASSVTDFEATGALSGQSSTVAGSAVVGRTSSGALSAQAAAVAGSAVVGRTASGALSAQAASIAGAATVGRAASGALAAQAAQIAGTVTISRAATGALSAQGATISGAADTSSATPAPQPTPQTTSFAAGGGGGAFMLTGAGHKRRKKDDTARRDLEAAFALFERSEPEVQAEVREITAPVAKRAESGASLIQTDDLLARLDLTKRLLDLYARLRSAQIEDEDEDEFVLMGL